MEKMDVAASLDVVRETREKLADKMYWPFWRHAATGVFLAIILLGRALPDEYGLPVTLLCLLPILAIVAHDKKTHGMFVSGYQKGRTGWVIAAILALFLAAFFWVMLGMDDPLTDPRFWALEAVVIVASTALSYLWAKVYRADLREGRA